MANKNDVRKRNPNGNLADIPNGKPISGKNDVAFTKPFTKPEDANSPVNTKNLMICVGCIYASL